MLGVFQVVDPGLCAGMVSDGCDGGRFAAFADDRVASLVALFPPPT